MYEKAAHIALKANVENSCSAYYTEWTFESCTSPNLQRVRAQNNLNHFTN